MVTTFTWANIAWTGVTDFYFYTNSKSAVDFGSGGGGCYCYCGKAKYQNRVIVGGWPSGPTRHNLKCTKFKYRPPPADIIPPDLKKKHHNW